ncbi:GlxA family transcriptional regulator [Elstera sp.]|jgi:transcriptional regulator GlxA family with amidase domain|uniref:GlxA family transcriptional regulator n=1 Tax=Elstera sp. TaxID=1916664 RepID=UPI0037BFD01D
MRTIVLLTFPLCQSLDCLGPTEVFTKANLHFRLKQGAVEELPYRILHGSVAGGPVTTSCGLAFGPTLPLADLPDQIDTLVIVGGNPGVEMALAEGILPAWVRQKAPSCRRIVSVCTGAFLLAETGLMAGRRMTTHWHSCTQLAETYPDIRVEPDAIYVSAPPFYSSAGITAAIDLALALVEEDLGQAIALAVARELVLYLRRPGGQSQFSTLLATQARSAERTTDGKLGDLLTWIAAHPAEDLRVPALAARVGLAERSFIRHFTARTGQTPARYVEGVRLERARLLLETGAQALAEIASAAGFGSTDSLTRALRRALGVTPDLYRARFGGGAHAPAAARRGQPEAAA